MVSGLLSEELGNYLSSLTHSSLNRVRGLNLALEPRRTGTFRLRLGADRAGCAAC